MNKSTLLLLALVCLPLPTLASSQQQSHVQQILFSLGVQRFFAAVEPLVDSELLRWSDEDDGAAPERHQLIRQQLSASSLQASVDEILLQHYDAALYQQGIELLSQQALVAVIQSCHGQALQDYGPQLDAYQQQLARQAARPDRQRLALALDQAARTSELSSQLHSAIERIVYTRAATSDVEPTIPWQKVALQRQGVLQEAVQTWYLYCGRYFRDDLLQALVDTYQARAIQQLLDLYQAAVEEALDRATATIDGHIAH